MNDYFTEKAEEIYDIWVEGSCDVNGPGGLYGISSRPGRQALIPIITKTLAKEYERGRADGRSDGLIMPGKRECLHAAAQHVKADHCKAAFYKGARWAIKDFLAEEK